ncbi:MAG: hypothetical protein EOM29_03700 [Bacteroidia bacterium]|nr:hypothetical protein [Bacteroidia bacterium]
MKNFDLDKMSQFLDSLKLSQKESDMIKGGAETIPPRGGDVPPSQPCTCKPDCTLCTNCVALCTNVCAIDEP